MQSGVKVEGASEVKRAFDKVATNVSDLQEGHQKEADALLSDVVNATRSDSGRLRSAWGTDATAKDARFINDEEYEGVQEWGWDQHNIEPTHAIVDAWERNTNTTEAIYAEAIRDIAERANIDTD